ncbi:hypothetical protein AMS68_006389 [Peltaster fructicola]|uniref:Uncharacterized protein n=1 Tax=Peltaster fructicola TaxID=286661 RepID=A0A6H0Y1F5_9PEZI|nr:hypothetical protein AMS68_006389 [Peltaster fructicola]
MRISSQMLSRSLLRPFPFQLSVGNDIVRVSRISRLLFSDADDAAQSRFLHKLFTNAELLQFQARFPKLQDARNDIAQTQLISQHVAGRLRAMLNHHRFAAKEAIIKACTWRRLLLRNVEIHQRSEASGVYGVILNVSIQDTPASTNTTTESVESAAQDPMLTANGQVVQVSISHEDEYATAVCIAAIEPTPGDVGGEAAARQP